MKTSTKIKLSNEAPQPGIRVKHNFFGFGTVVKNPVFHHGEVNVWFDYHGLKDLLGLKNIRSSLSLPLLY